MRRVCAESAPHQIEVQIDQKDLLHTPTSRSILLAMLPGIRTFFYSFGRVYPFARSAEGKVIFRTAHENKLCTNQGLWVIYQV